MQTNLFPNTAPPQTPETLNRDVLILERLLSTEGLGLKTLLALLKLLGSPSAIWSAPHSVLSKILSNKQLEHLNQQRKSELTSRWIDHYHEKGIQIVPISSPDYPFALKETSTPPPLLYVKGKLSALNHASPKNQRSSIPHNNLRHSRMLGVVGSRQVTGYGKQVIRALIKDLSPYSVCIVSGLAAGVDTEAHWSALNNNLPTVAVFGCGLDTIYPSENKRLASQILETSGALVSEYPLDTAPDRFRFPQRNRIVSGLCSGVLIVEGHLKSGSLITARHALEEGRSVFAVPGNIFEAGSQGPLSLIQQGAVPVSGVSSIAEEFDWLPDCANKTVADRDLHKLPASNRNTSTGFQTREIPSTQQKISIQPPEKVSLIEHLGDIEKQVYGQLPEHPVLINELSALLNFSLPAITEALTMLELEDLVELQAGAKVCKLN